MSAASVAVQFGKAIADATRQEIMRYCCCEWRAVLDIAARVGVSQPTASQHLAVLRAAGLVNTRREGKQIFYTLDQNAIATCCGRLLVDFAPEERATALLCDSGCCVLKTDRRVKKKGGDSLEKTAPAPCRRTARR